MIIKTNGRATHAAVLSKQPHSLISMFVKAGLFASVPSASLRYQTLQQGERKGQNKYYPPDFNPQKHKSLDAYHGTHPLRERAKKIHLGILEIRFEMPYNIWCGGCGIHIAMGVRYNAEKSKIGKYYTTPVYQFRMRCHLCPNYIVIKTEPATHEYIITEGARRKEQRWDPKENGQIETEDKDVQKKMASDAMFNLEHVADDKLKVATSKPIIDQLEAMKDVWKDDYSLNRRLRDSFRTRKQEIKAQETIDNDLLKKSSLDLVLLPETDEDRQIAHLLNKYKTVNSAVSEDEKKKMILGSSIFGASASSAKNNSSSSSSSKKKAKYDHRVSFSPNKASKTDGGLSTLKNSMIKRTSSTTAPTTEQSQTSADQSKDTVVTTTTTPPPQSKMVEVAPTTNNNNNNNSSLCDYSASSTESE